MSQRWAPICGDCWAVAEPDQYFPEATTYDECAACGHLCLVVNAHPEVARKAISANEHADLLTLRSATR